MSSQEAASSPVGRRSAYSTDSTEQRSPVAESKTRLSRRFAEMMETEDGVVSSINELIVQLEEVLKVSCSEASIPAWMERNKLANMVSLSKSCGIQFLLADVA